MPDVLRPDMAVRNAKLEPDRVEREAELRSPARIDDHRNNFSRRKWYRMLEEYRPAVI